VLLGLASAGFTEKRLEEFFRQTISLVEETHPASTSNLSLRVLSLAAIIGISSWLKDSSDSFDFLEYSTIKFISGVTMECNQFIVNFV